MADTVLKKMKRSQFWTYLDTTPTTTSTWGLLGKGIKEYAIAYNPQVTTEKDITQDNASSSLDSNQKQGDVSQEIYVGDPCYEYANSLLDKVGADVQTHILDIDTAHAGTTVGTYKAKKSDGILVPTKLMGENATIEYSLYYNGDPVEGTVVITSGKPVFTANA